MTLPTSSATSRSAQVMEPQVIVERHQQRNQQRYHLQQNQEHVKLPAHLWVCNSSKTVTIVEDSMNATMGSCLLLRFVQIATTLMRLKATATSEHRLTVEIDLQMTIAMQIQNLVIVLMMMDTSRMSITAGATLFVPTGFHQR